MITATPHHSDGTPCAHGADPDQPGFMTPLFDTLHTSDGRPVPLPAPPPPVCRLGHPLGHPLSYLEG